MQLFSAGPRIDAQAPDPKESAFAYLDRSGRAEADALRGLIEDWLGLYPADKAPSLAARLRSPRDDQHRGAFFELLLHRALLCLGHRVLAVEPRLAHTAKSPDFLVESGEGGRFYLEGISAQGRDLHAVLKRKASRYGALDLPLTVAVDCAEDEATLRHTLELLWHGPRGPQRRALSAVLAVERTDPWAFADRRIRLIRNPWADIPLPPMGLGHGKRLGCLPGLLG